MGHVRKGRQARARRCESALARQAEERARSTTPDVPRATGTPVSIQTIDEWEVHRRVLNWEIRLMLAASLPPRDHNWFLISGI